MNTLRTAMLLAVMTALFMGVGYLIGGSSGALIALAVAAATNVFAYWNSDKMVLSMYGAQEVTRAESPNLYDLVEQLAANAGLPMPKVCIIESDVPNAFATGRNPSHAAVAVTTGIMQVLDYNELAGVLGHELSHVKNRDILTSTIAAMMANVITYAAQFMAFFGGRSDDDDGGNPIAAIAMVILAPIAAMLIQMAISRSREYEADHDGGVICGNPNNLADALEKIEYYATNAQPMRDATPATAHMFIINPLKGSGAALANLFSTHPQTAERIARLRQQATEMHIR